MADFTVGNFFRYYVAHPNDAPKEDKAKARALTALFSIITVGIVPLAVLAISKIRWKTFDDFANAQFEKTQNVAGQVIGQSDWVRQMQNDVGPVKGNLAATHDLERVKDKLNELLQLSQAHQDIIARLKVEKKKQKNNKFQFNPKMLSDLQRSIKELKNLAEIGEKKNVEIDQPLRTAQRAQEAYVLEMARFEEEVDIYRSHQKDSF